MNDSESNLIVYFLPKHPLLIKSLIHIDINTRDLQCSISVDTAWASSQLYVACLAGMAKGNKNKLK